MLQVILHEWIGSVSITTFSIPEAKESIGAVNTLVTIGEVWTRRAELRPLSGGEGTEQLRAKCRFWMPKLFPPDWATRNTAELACSRTAPHLPWAFFRWSPLTYTATLDRDPTLSTQSHRAHRIYLVFNNDSTILTWKSDTKSWGRRDKWRQFKENFRNLAEIEV